MPPSADVVDPDGSNPESTLVIGRLLAPHGVRGWIKFRSHTEDPETCFSFLPWSVLDRNDRHVPLQVSAWQPQGDHFLLRLEGVDDRDAAALLAGKDVHAPLSELPEPGEDEVYWRDLVGMTVVNRSGEVLGQVRDLMDNGAHDILVIGGAETEILVPYVGSYIDRVEREQRVIVVDWQKDWS